MTRRFGSRRHKPKGVPMPEWKDGIPPGVEYVCIRFICERRGHKAQIVGEFCSYTHDAAIADESLREPWMRRLSDGTIPEDATSPAAKPLLQCPCGHERQISMERMRTALAQIWEPHGRRAVDYRI